MAQSIKNGIILIFKQFPTLVSKKFIWWIFFVNTSVPCEHLKNRKDLKLWFKYFLTVDLVMLRWNKPHINAISLLLNSKSRLSVIVLVRTILNYLFESKIQNATIYCPNHRCVFIFYHIVWLYAFYVTYFTGVKVWSYVRTIIWFLTFSLVLVHIFINIHILNWPDKIYIIISLAMYQNMASKIRIPSLTQMWKSPNFRSSSFDHFPATLLWHLTNVFLPHILIDINIVLCAWSSAISKGQKEIEK